jgi:hypothetical protein
MRSAMRSMVQVLIRFVVQIGFLTIGAIGELTDIEQHHASW